MILSKGFSCICTSTDHPLRVVRVGQFVLQEVYGHRSVFTDFNGKLYGHGMQSFLLCDLSVALSVTSVPIASYSVASSLYAVLSVVLTIVHFDSTSILSLHTM